MTITLTSPQIPETGVIVAVPHAGRHYPPELRKACQVSESELRRLEDPWVDALTEGVERVGAWHLKTSWARAFADVNRAPREMDPAAVVGYPAGALEGSAKARVGLGVVPTRIGTRALYGSPLSRFDVELRLQLAYRPYHEALRALLADLKTRHAEIILLDCHSMPETAQAGGPTVDLVIGDAHGRAASAWAVEVAEAAGVAHGLNVALNRPYAGGYVTQHHGRPARGVHVLQLEVRRKLYLREDQLVRHRGEQRIAGFFAALVRNLGETLAARRASIAVAGE